MIVEFIKNASKLYIFDKKALSNLEKSVSWKTPYFTLLILSSISLMGSLTITFLQEGISLPYSPIFILMGALLSIIFTALSIFISSGIIFLLLKLVGGKAKFLDTLKIYASIGTISTTLSFIIIILNLGIPVTQSLIIAIISFITAMLSTSIALWALITNVVSLARLHKIPYIKSVIALIIIPLLFVIILAILIVLIALSMSFLI